jgi:redox-sensitive bicupin YhaK (pirin superfamily)
MLIINTKNKLFKNSFKYRTENTLKLPVWPVYGGVVAQILEWLRAKNIIDKILNTVGGRVVPMPLSELNLSPYLLLVHHCHSFLPFDPVRALTRFILPEGFPAHPHSGFSTVTYCIEGGLSHRDSEGNQMSYGNGDVQWMKAGRGTIHEEMWDLERFQYNFHRIELFQIWVNLPTSLKQSPPQVTVLKNENIPIHILPSGVSIKIIAGSLELDNGTVISGPGNDLTSSPLGIYHINIPFDKNVNLQLRIESTCGIYVRRGSVINGRDNDEEYSTNILPSDNQKEHFSGSLLTLLSHQFQSTKKQSYLSESDTEGIKNDSTQSFEYGSFNIQAGGNGADILLLTGKPINEPVVMQGPFVHSSVESWKQSAILFNQLGSNAFWDYKLSNQEWLQHCRKLNLQDILGKSLIKE